MVGVNMPVHPLSLSLGLVAGLAAGSALGYLVSKWMKEQHDRAQAEATAFNAILDEIHQLRELLRETKEQLEVLRPSTNSRTSLRALDTESEYFSTYDSAGEDEEDFFDLPPETPETNDRCEYCGCATLLAFVRRACTQQGPPSHV